MSLQEIVVPLLKWYDENARDLPWRHNPEAYTVWVSEIMLQQTRVESVKEYYRRFLEHLPTVKELSHAKEEELLKLWEGLGYYNRVRNMQKAAQVVEQDYQGRFPNSFEELKALPGIGDYTAGAVASIAFQIPVPAVDGNVLRIVMRLTGDFKDISKEATKVQVKELLSDIIPNRPGDFNQALMDLGAGICIPNGEPLCEKCPLSCFCRANKEKLTGQIPVSTKKKARVIEQKTVLILSTSSGMALRKRPSKGLLAGMYEPPLEEGYLDESEVLQKLREWEYHPIFIERIADAKHIFSHREWHMIAYRVRLDDILDNYKEDKINKFFFADVHDLQERFPLPSAFSAYRQYFH